MNFFEKIVEIFSTAEYRNYIFQGFGSTLIITAVAVAIGLLLGFVVAVTKVLAKSSKAMKPFAAVCELYTTVFRGTPVALQLFLFVFAIFAIPGFKPYAVIICFGINSGAYVSESIRAGIESVDQGQFEAGRSLGLNEFTTMRKIILPQAVKNVVPAIGNEIIALLKETSIISMVGSTVGTMTFDLTKASNTIAIKMSDYFVPTLVSGAFYLIVVLLITLLIRYIEKGFKKYERHS